MNKNAIADLDHELLTHVGVAPDESSASDLMRALAQEPRQQLAERWVQTQASERAAKARRVYYLSMEFLMGRSLGNALDALNLRADAAAAIAAHSRRLEEVEEEEADAALGNGGLGRLAACFLDSMAT
ncbi:MAG TPA: glycogen/starch/alpha-glucan phosphorylase, partial [Burkholderiaceae bacterium]|nr:glycogen/starch/alpha-glucan phosphorylase [Burkholderiaceae bacterium]